MLRLLAFTEQLQAPQVTPGSSPHEHWARGADPTAAYPGISHTDLLCVGGEV